jgi:acyl-CoA reductase-like NAD-dependent aldehyde dehydrogenase/nicotinamidase-related amidase
MTPLLLLVDLQRDNLANPELEPAAGPVVSRAGALLRACREIGVPVVHVWTTVSRRDDRRMPHWRREGRWRCEEGTPGHAPPPGLEPVGQESVVHKTSYSAFSGGELDRMLSDQATDVLVVAGVHLHGCVRQAVLDAYERGGVEIWVAEDATASDDPAHAASTRRYLERRAATFLTVSEVVGRLRRPDGEGARGESIDRLVHVTAGHCRAALGGWRRVEAGERTRALERLADQLEPEAESLAHEMAVRIGKPVRYGSVEVRRTAQMLRAVVRDAAGAGAEQNGTAEVRRRALGVVATVTPWNSPVYISLGKIGPALAYGNAVLWKPAPAAQAISERLAGMFDDAGLPPGIVGLVSGGRRAAEASMTDPQVDAVTLTGSSLAGFTAQEICARRRIPLQAELGGNNAAVVWPDADLGHAAREIAEGAFALAGQRCTANRRVVVHRGCAGQFLELLRVQTAALPWGDPRRYETRVGPLVSADDRRRVADVVARADGSAGPVLVPHGSAEPSVDGFEAGWYPPTIVRCDDPAHEVVQEESFGPVLVVQTAEDWDHAIELVNGVRQGLVAGLFSSSDELRNRFLDEAAAGILKINRSTADAEVDVPFGGWKWSGIGPPEHGSFDRDFYTRPQVVYQSPAAA